MINKLLRRITTLRLKKDNGDIIKNNAELFFWENEINNYIDWYEGKKELYQTPPPVEKEKIILNNIKDSAILTWHKIHQEKKYLNDLLLESNSFNNMRLLDVGAGPIPSATVFKDSELFSLDHLMGNYIQAGFPLHYYEKVKFVNSKSEHMPFEDNFFDAVISVNAIDHVDDFQKTANEIKRVIKKDGLFRMHVHYHKKTVCEPNEINDKIFLEAYKWVNNLSKIYVTDHKLGFKLPEDEFYSVWSNF